MKKLFKILLTLLAVFGIATAATACEKPEKEQPSGGEQVNQNQLVVNKVAEEFKLSVTNKVKGNFPLPTTAKGGVTITWSSDKTNIAIEGQNATVTRPAFADGDITVTLTAVFKLGDATATKTYTVVVEKQEDVAQIEALTVAEALAAEIGDKLTVRGVVSGYHVGSQNHPESKQGFYLTDTTGTIYVYGYLLAAEVNVGDDVVVDATKAEHNGALQLTGPTLKQTVSTGNTVSTAAADTTTTIADLASNLQGAYYGKTFIFKDVQIDRHDGGTYVSYTIKDANGNAVNLYSGGNGGEFAVYDQFLGQNLDIFYVVNGQNKNGTKWRGHILSILKVTEVEALPEPAKVQTTIAELAATKPTTSMAAIYEVTGFWTLDQGKETYGNGVLKDADGNQITIYGFCASNSVLTWNKTAYDYKNNKSYASMNVYSGAEVKVGMVYDVAHDNYSIYLIELLVNGEAPEVTPDPDQPEQGNTIADALAAYSAAGNEDTSVTIKAVVKSIDTAYDSGFKNICVTVCDSTGSLYCYRLSGGSDLEVGTVIIINGTITKYGGAMQIGQGGTYTIVSDLTEADKANYAKDILSIETYVENAITLPLSGTYSTTIAWTSSDANIISINDGVATVTQTANEQTVTLTASITLGETTVSKDFTVKVAAKTNATLVGSVSFKDATGRTEVTNGSEYNWVQNGITVVHTKNSGNAINTSYLNPLRVYKGHGLKISYATNITKIVLNCNTASYATAFGTTLNGASVSINGNQVIITLDTPATSFAIAAFANQVRIDSIDVYAMPE